MTTPTPRTDAETGIKLLQLERIRQLERELAQAQDQVAQQQRIARKSVEEITADLSRRFFAEELTPERLSSLCAALFGQVVSQAQADAAAMRAFLEQASDTANFASSGPFFFASCLIQKARDILAATTAGADILAERDGLRAEVWHIHGRIGLFANTHFQISDNLPTDETFAKMAERIEAWKETLEFREHENTGQAVEIEKLRAEAASLKQALAKQHHEITQTLGKALGYPWYKDDQKNFPNATEADGVCVGEHVAESIATEAARKIEELRAEVAELQSKLSNAHIETKAIDALYREMAYKILPREEEIIRLRAEVERLRGIMSFLDKQGGEVEQMESGRQVWTLCFEYPEITDDGSESLEDAVEAARKEQP